MIFLCKLHCFVLFNENRLVYHHRIRLAIIRHAGKIPESIFSFWKRTKRTEITAWTKILFAIIANCLVYGRLSCVCKFIWWKRTKSGAFTRARSSRHILRHEPREFQLYFLEYISPLLLIATFNDCTRHRRKKNLRFRYLLSNGSSLSANRANPPKWSVMYRERVTTDLSKIESRTRIRQDRNLRPDRARLGGCSVDKTTN